MTQLSSQAIIEAGNELAVREATGHNDGPAVKMFLNSVGLTEGYPWCMAFIYWCVRRAAAKLGLKNPLKETGGALDEYNSHPELHLTKPEQGCVGILDLGGGHGHAFIVTGIFIDDGMVVHTIEGNTNDNGSAEGIGVFRHTRPISSVHGWLKLPDIPL